MSCTSREVTLPIESQAVVDGWSVTKSGTNWTLQNAFRYDALPTPSVSDLSKTYYSLKSLQTSYPWQTASVAGQFASFSKTFDVDSLLPIGVTPTEYYLNLWVKDSYSGTTSGYHIKEVLVGNSIIWSDDVAGSETTATADNGWRKVRENISNKVLADRRVTVTLRVREQAGVSDFGFDVYWDNISISFDNSTNRLVRQTKIRGTYATYAGMQTKLNGGNDTADIQELIAEVTYSKSNTYNYLLWNENSAENKGRRWKLFREQILGELKNVGKKAWVTLVPPTENQSCGKTFNSEPYGSDYELWAKEIAGLSLDYDNLTAFSIDDFDNNLPSNDTTCLPDYSVSAVADMMSSAHAVNPFLAFVPVAYHSYTPNFIHGPKDLEMQRRFDQYAPYIDGLQFAYIQDTVGAGENSKSLWRTVNLYDQIQRIKDVIGDTPLIIFVYATGYTGGGSIGRISTPEYVLEVAQKALDYADGVDIYQLQKQSDPDSNTNTLHRPQQKREVVRQLFSETFDQANLNQRQRVYVLSSGDELVQTDGKRKKYFYSPYWLDATGDQQFIYHQYVLAGDFDNNGLDEIAVFYDYPGTASTTPQRVFVYKAKFVNGVPAYSLELVPGSGTRSSWLDETIATNNFDEHQYALVGDFMGDTSDEIAIFRDYPDGRQRVFIYRKNPTSNSFEKIVGSKADGSWLDETDGSIVMTNFDNHQYALVGNFDASGKDEIAVFYDDPNGTQSIFVFRKSASGNSLAQVNGTAASGAWFSNKVSVHDFDAHQFSLAGNFDGVGGDEFAVFYDYLDGKQRIFVYKKNASLNRFDLTDGALPGSSWFNTTTSRTDFDRYEYGLAGNFDGSGEDDFTVFYDYPDSDPYQRAFVYEKSAGNYFSILNGNAGDERDSPSSPCNGPDCNAWFKQSRVVHNFDKHVFAIAAQLYDEDPDVTKNRDEIIIFYAANSTSVD